MKKLVLLILLFCWNHASGHSSRCSTGVVITNRAISLPSSTHAGAKVLLLRKYQAHSLVDCLEECCSEKPGPCSIVEYKKNSSDVNCLSYSCQPIRKCKFTDSDGTDTFTFPYASQDLDPANNAVYIDGEDYDKLKTMMLNESSSTPEPQKRTFKDRARAVAARKGVEPFTSTVNNEGNSASLEELYTAHMENYSSSKLANDFKDPARTVVARKGVNVSVTSATHGDSAVPWKEFSETYLENGDSSKSFDTVTVQDVLGKTDASFKNDNTTIKPRKGVDMKIELVSAKIKPRKGVEAPHSSEIVSVLEASRSKVKARKGALPLPFSLTIAPVINNTASLNPVLELSTTSTAHTVNIKEFGETLSSYVTLPTDLISVLEQVFRDESPTPGASSEFRYGSHTPGISASKSFTVSSSSISWVKHEEYTTLPLNSEVADRSSTARITESPLMPFHTVLPSKSSRHHEGMLQSTPPLAVISDHVTQQSVSSTRASGQTPIPSHTPPLQTSMRDGNSISSDESDRYHDNTVMLFTASQPNETKILLSATDDSESERKYKSSMHLVLSLVFGLLVLFAVLGAVAKRVYDVWMRRHYHRMDFLIDGMYDGFS